MLTILAGDIGGTKTTLAIYTHSTSRLACIKQETYASHDFHQFNDLLREFINSHVEWLPKTISLSVAGPIEGEICKTTNLPWIVSSASLRSEFGFENVLLSNDIEATGYGLIHCHGKDLEQINPNARISPGNRCIISIGTGLGEAMLFWDGSHFHPVGTEGGHEDFAPLSSSDFSLWQHLHQRFSGHVSYERVVSGPGIEAVYDYLCLRDQSENKAPEQNKGAWITQHAIQQSDTTCIECVEIVLRYLASEAANLALKTMSVGGVYIAGGIAPKIAPLLKQSSFLHHFTSKGRFKPLMDKIPIWINHNFEAPILGAVYRASIEQTDRIGLDSPTT